MDVTDEHKLVTLVIDSNSISHRGIVELLCDLYIEQNQASNKIISLKLLHVRIGDDKKISYYLPENIIIPITYQGELITCLYKQVTKNYGGSYNVFCTHEIILKICQYIYIEQNSLRITRKKGIIIYISL